MAEIYKLSDGTSSVDLSPIRGLNVPENPIREHLTTKAGISDDYEWGNAEQYDIPLINLSKAQSDQLLAWWLDMTKLTFTPDQGAPGTTYDVIIDGNDRPLDMWHIQFDEKFAGILKLCEVSSESFSSSHISVSQSQSCSTHYSTSCSTFSSISQSEYIVGVESSSSCWYAWSYLSQYSTFEYIDIYSSSNSASGWIYWTESSSTSAYEYLSSSSYSCIEYTLTVGSYSGSLNPQVSECDNSVIEVSCSESAGGIY